MCHFIKKLGKGISDIKRNDTICHPTQDTLELVGKEIGSQIYIGRKIGSSGRR